MYFAMKSPTKKAARLPSYLFPWVIVLSVFSLTVLILLKVDDVAAQTKTLAGHNLEPTPWHLFTPKSFAEEARHSRTYKIIHCSYLSCGTKISNIGVRQRLNSHSLTTSKECPDLFRWIHYDLEPWSQTRISKTHLDEAKKSAAFRIVIIGGRLYVDLYYACVQSRALFTIWGLLQLLRRYPGMVPDVDMMFDCMDKPSISRTEHKSMPLPLFRYCTTKGHFDIPFPDWSFWGWPEININPWDVEFSDIKSGSKKKSWSMKGPVAYWKGNPDVNSPIRTELLKCNDAKTWGAKILRQNWIDEAKAGYGNSKLSNQCDYRYKIYAEGYAWSVSLKYILSCGSQTLIISPKYEDFFSRGLIPNVTHWPIPSNDLCPSIKAAVDWGNAHPRKAFAMGKRAQDFMESMDMDTVYDYMFHLISEYSKLQDFKPVQPPDALEVCADSLLCLANPKEKQVLEKSAAFPSSKQPCSIRPGNSHFIKEWLKQRKTIRNVENIKLRK